MKPLLHVYLLAAFASLVASQNPEFPKISDIMYSQYQFKAEVTSRPVGPDNGELVTLFLEEYFDRSNDMGRVDFTDRGERITVFYYNKTQQLAMVIQKPEQKTCEVTHVDSSNALIKNAKFYKWTCTTREGNFVFGPSAYFCHISKLKLPKYVGKETVRGIETNHYVTFLEKDKFKVDIYMSVENWTNPFYSGSTKKQFPVRMLVNETVVLDDGSKFTLILLVDITSFKSGDVSMAYFSIPSGIGCDGLANVRPFPKLSKEFIVVAEVYNRTKEGEKETTVIDNYRVMYLDHGDGGFGRMDFYTSDKMGTYEVYDFNTGVKYSFDAMGRCIIGPMIDTFFEWTRDNLDHVIKSPEEILNIDERKVYYLGKKFNRGINCDVWEVTYINYKTGTGIFFQRYVQTYHFTAYNWIDDESGVEEVQVPIKYEINAYNASKLIYNIEVNLFNYLEQLGFNEFAKYFSVERCFPQPSLKKYIELYFPSPVAEVSSFAEENNRKFIEETYQVLTGIMGLSFLRIPFVTVDYEEDKVLETILLLERTDPIQSFQFLSYNVHPGSRQLKVNLSRSGEVSECAEECLKRPTCKYFHFCDVQGCYLSLEDITGPVQKEVPGTKFCTWYRKAEINATDVQKPLVEVIEDLDKIVKEKAFNLTILSQSKDGKQEEFTFSATSMNEIDPFSNLDKDAKGFDEFLPFTQLPSPEDNEMVFSGGEVDTRFDCYRVCKNDESLVCQMFSFCAQKMTCLYSGKSFKPATLVNITGCNTYQVSFLKMFDKLDGKVLASKGDKEEKEVSVETCAELCRVDQKDLPCRSFDYCPKTRTCTMYKAHYLEIKGTVKSSEMCDHYALKYSLDYITAGHFVMPAFENVTDISEENCAKVCTETSNGGCQSYTYCRTPQPEEGTSICSLSSVNFFDKNSNSVGAPDNCELFARNSDTLFLDKQPVTPKKKNTGYTPGGLAGLIFGMLFLGMVIGALAFLGYSYYRARRGDDGMTVRFVKNENL